MHKTPFHIMELQDVRELMDFFDRNAPVYQLAVQGKALTNGSSE
jgi:hypothetical protein